MGNKLYAFFEFLIIAGTQPRCFSCRRFTINKKNAPVKLITGAFMGN